LVTAFVVVGTSSSDAQSVAAPPAEILAERRARLLGAVGSEAVVAVGSYLIRSSEKQAPDFWYLTGVESRYAVLVLLPGQPHPREILFLPDEFQFAGAQYPMKDDRFRRAAWNRPHRRLFPGPQAEQATGIAETFPVDEFGERIRDLLGDRSVVYYTRDGSVLYAPPGLSAPSSFRQQFEASLAQLLPEAEIRDATPSIDRLRLVKDQYEIAALRRAAQISAVGFVEALHSIRPGMRDLAIAGVMEAVWKREGASRTSFGPIVSSGPSSMLLYTLRAENYDFADRVMETGDLLFMDYGAAEYMMYASDVCRTYPVSGRFTDEQRRYYEIVLEAQNAALSIIRPGVMMIDVIRAAAAVYQAHGLEQYEDVDRMGIDGVWGLMPSPTYWLTQGGSLTRYSGARGIGVRDLGHHVGLDATDSRDYDVPLEAGMVFTVEPKMYVPQSNIAIMIEDVILVTEDGYENLSANAPKEIEEIERIMAGGAPRD
jgi:Xaa-Pro aminopeptidase